MLKKVKQTIYKSRIKSPWLMEALKKNCQWLVWFLSLYEEDQDDNRHKNWELTQRNNNLWLFWSLILRILKWNNSHHNTPRFCRRQSTELQQGFHPTLIPQWLFVFHNWWYFLLLQRVVMTQHLWPTDGPWFSMKTWASAPPDHRLPERLCWGLQRKLLILF